ncbi:MAG: NAD-dependent epimerase/dehydratase family protein, partial [Nitrospirae bacterium]|nr:NAD-dependent epimerase/dehydratase family protein [Nitrospirota bacterium]
MKAIAVTGCAGFIGCKVSEKLLENGYSVVGIDNMNDYYDPKLKEWRLRQLRVKSEELRVTKEAISKNTFTVIPACRESFLLVRNREEGLRTSRNDNLRGFTNDPISKTQNFSFYKCDIGNYNEIKTVFSDHKIDAVINLAARAGVRA